VNAAATQIPPDLTRTAIAAVREFNRRYTRGLGLLEQGLLGTGFTLTQSRVLYELAHRDGANASDIGRDLALDAGYLSRLVKGFESGRLVRRKRSALDARQSTLHLTTAGRAAFDRLDAAASEQAGRLVARLAPAQQQQLLGALACVQRLVQEPDGAGPAFALRGLQVGDIGWIIRRQGQLYAQEYGWDIGYEALVAEILSAFVRDFQPRKENAWVAMRDGEIVGSVFLVRESDALARLRLLYVEPAARGLGIGRRLVEECITDARARGYRKLTLWTNDVLVSARRIYEAAGFRLTSQKPHRSFGKRLVGQTWVLAL